MNSKLQHQSRLSIHLREKLITLRHETEIYSQLVWIKMYSFQLFKGWFSLLRWLNAAFYHSDIRLKLK